MDLSDLKSPAPSPPTVCMGTDLVYDQEGPSRVGAREGCLTLFGLRACQSLVVSFRVPWLVAPTPVLASWCPRAGAPGTTALLVLRLA